MGRIYTVEFSEVAVSAAQDLFELTAAADKPLRIHAILLGQSSDAGDAEAELLNYKLIRGHTTSGSGGTSATPRPMDENDAAAGATCEVNNTTVASAGTAVDLISDTFNVQVGLQLWFTPETRPRIENGALGCLRITAPADAITLSGTMIVEEG
jgi:hypothetical protein